MVPLFLHRDAEAGELGERGGLARPEVNAAVPDVDSLYFTMLNGNKRSVTLNPKTEAGTAIFTRLIEECDVMVENFAPGAIDRMGFPWEKIQEINPRLIYASVNGFGPGPYEDLKVYENVAQCTGGAASTTGQVGGVPTVTGAQIGDSGTGIHLVAGILAALFHPAGAASNAPLGTGFIMVSELSQLRLTEATFVEESDCTARVSALDDAEEYEGCLEVPPAAICLQVAEGLRESDKWWECFVEEAGCEEAIAGHEVVREEGGYVREILLGCTETEMESIFASM